MNIYRIILFDIYIERKREICMYIYIYIERERERERKERILNEYENLSNFVFFW